MPRHIVCITFDHDHLSGFIARGLTSPTAISRGEYDMVVIPGLMNATSVLENFVDDYTYMTRVCDFGILTYTFHPHVIGRGHRMMMLERLIQRLIEGGAVFSTMEDAMEEWLAHQRGGRRAAAD